MSGDGPAWLSKSARAHSATAAQDSKVLSCTRGSGLNQSGSSSSISCAGTSRASHVYERHFPTVATRGVRAVLSGVTCSGTPAGSETTWRSRSTGAAY